ncbi:unnamed protein product [Polarella glacialis]|uniref:Uncharacterized protein n=2 Tax=Polarella glacialis TaxID=89957 RepID=A0A813LFS4_POLGL|nr:unnamed protein product [Polarella glacialis]
MNYRHFSKVRGEASAAFDEIEDWMLEVFGENRDALLPQLCGQDLDLAVAQRRRGMRYFAAGRSRDQRMFASILFPLFHGDPHERNYREAVEDILRVAGSSVQPKTRHKLSFDLGILFFTSDAHGNMFGVVASGDFPLSEAFKFLEKMLEVYEGIDIAVALDGADSTLWSEQQFRDDAFGVRNLAIDIWKTLSRPGDGSFAPGSYDV